MVEAEGEEEEKTGLETGMGDQAGEMRDLLREMRENLEIVDGMTGARKREKRSERREGERGRAGGGRRPCLLTCKLHSLPIRRRRRGEKQISSRSLKELRRVERSKTEDCRSRMKSPLDSRRRLSAAEKQMMASDRRVLAKREWRQQWKASKGRQIGISRAPLPHGKTTLENRQNRTHCRMTT